MSVGNRDVHIDGRLRTFVARVRRVVFLALLALGIAPAFADIPLLNTTILAAAGGSHNCAVNTAGGLKCWGSNGNGQVGDGTTIDRPTAVNVFGLASGVTAVAGGYLHSCALIGGGVKCWGYNGYGQLGDGTTTQHLTPVAVNGLASGVVAITAGAFHTCALLNTDIVKCWGYNGRGQLGDNSNVQRTNPVTVQGLGPGVTVLAAGGYHTCAVTSYGVQCWGWNGYGQLGDGTTYDRWNAGGYIDIGLTAVPSAGFPPGVTALSGGFAHTCGLAAGGVYCWGSNSVGQLGDGTQVDRWLAVSASGLASGNTAVSTGAYHTCVRTSGAGIKCFGYNLYGQVGNGTFVDQLTAVDVTGLASGAAAVAAGAYHSCARMNGGGVKCWGHNFFGQLGRGEDYDDSEIPVTVLTEGATVITNPATGVSMSGATLNGLVSSNGAITGVTFQYGQGVNYGTTVTAAPSPLAAGATNVPVSATISGLSCNTTYHVRVVGTNSDGTALGNDVTFRTVQCPTLKPTVITRVATGVTASAATINGSVWSNGSPTTVRFEYGLSTDYDNTVNAVPASLSAGAVNVSVSAQLTALTCGTTYYFRAVGVNGGGTTYGADLSFITSPCAAAATVVTNAASAIALNGATLNGTVTSNGTPTTVTFQYGLTTSYGSTATAAQSPLAAGASNAPVSAVVSGLACNKPYHFRAVGANGGGTAYGADLTFTTAACATTVITKPASGISTTGATLNGMVSSNGASTVAVFQYGPTTSYGTTVTSTQSPLAAGASDVPVSVAISGLDCGATYHFRAVGGNTAGTINGADLTFTATACAGTATRVEVGPGAPLTFVAVAVSNRSGKVRFTDTYYPDTPLTDYMCPATPIGQPGGSCSALGGCSQLGVDLRNQSACVADLSCLRLQPGCHYITAKYESGSDASSTSPPLPFPVIPPAPVKVTSVTAGNADTSVSFVPTDNGGSPMTSFTVIASAENGSGATVTATIAAAVSAGVDLDAGSLTTTHVMAGLINGVSYSFQVIANNELGASPVSLPSNVVTPIPATLSAYSLNYIQKVYVAYYGRPADPAGLAYWAGQMDAQGQSLGAIIGAFGNSEEFSRRYGGLGSAALITKIYQQTLGRDPDPAGLAYYVGELQAGRRTLQTITLDVLNGATTAPDATVVSNRLEVASYYTALAAAGCAYGTEQTGVDALSIVTAGAASVSSAKSLIDARCGGI